MNHKEKVTLARKLITPMEIKVFKQIGKGIFDSQAWERRKLKITDRVYHNEQVVIQKKIAKNL